jgi:hypothetical protein
VSESLGNPVFRAFLIIGATVDLLIALFLLIVSGWIIDSWHDPKEPWAGPIVTTVWSIAFVLVAGAPILAYRLSRQKAAPHSVAVAVWLPALLLLAICGIGLIVFPP